MTASLLGSAEIIVGLFVALAFDGFGLMVGIENHSGKSAIVTIFTPPAGAEHRVETVGTLARWRFAFESGFEPWHGTAERG